MKIKRRKKKEKPLNNRQKIYVLERASGKSGAEAARLAGYSDKKKYLVRITAYRLDNDPRIKAAIDKEREKIREKLIIDENKVLNDLEVGREGAIEKGQYMAAIRASELHGKHLAMFTDKVQTEYDVILQFKDSMEVASYGLIDTLKQLAGETGIEEVELEEVKTKRLKIKRRKRKRPKALLEDGNGNSSKKKEGNKNNNNNIQTADSIHDNPIDTPHKGISDPDWQPFSKL